MEDGTRKSGDLWSGVALAALGAYIVIQARQWEYSGTDGPGAGFFPFWYGVAILGLSALLIVSHLRRGSARGNAVDWTRLGRAFSTWFALAASVALFKPLGFVISFALLTYFIVAVMYRRPLKTAALTALASAAGFYLVFDSRSRAPPGRLPRVLAVEILAGLLERLRSCAGAGHLFWCFAGVLLGTVVGILPGRARRDDRMLLPLTST